MRQAHAEEAKAMNHRYQRFDWDSERGSHTVVEINVRKQITHATLRALAVSIAVCGLIAAIVLAWGWQ